MLIGVRRGAGGTGATNYCFVPSSEGSRWVIAGGIWGFAMPLLVV